MRHALGLVGVMLALAGLGGCPGGDDGTGDTSGIGTTTTGTPPTTTFIETSTGMVVEDTGSSGPASTSTAESTSSGAVVEDSSSSSGGGPVCDPVVVGEWNACIDESGDIDNTLCNWMGDPDSNGFITCLSAPPMKLDGGNICTIRDCVDTCDCFPAPATGTAVVVCAEILEGGGTACGLDCSSGETCPDGMECASGLCFWPAA
jgi:hypothetical protein